MPSKRRSPSLVAHRTTIQVAAASTAAIICVLLGWQYGVGAGLGAFTIGVAGYLSNRLTRREPEAPASEQANILERLQVATQAGGISAWEYDVAERRFVWDTNRPKGFGLDSEPIDSLAEKLTAVTHPDDRTLLFVDPERPLPEGETTYSVRFRIARPGFPVRHMQSFSRIVVSARGEAERVLGATWDITNEVQSVEMLQRQAEQEHTLLERYGIATQAAGISSWEMEFEPLRYSWHNNFDLEWLQRNDNDLIKATAKITHPSDRNVFRDAIREAIANRSDIIAYRARFLNRNGSWDWYQNHARLFFNGQNQIVRALGVNWSVTKEVEATEQLHASQRRMERASRSSSEGHFEWDLASQQAWHSASFHSLLGYALGELLLSIDAAEKLLRHPDEAAENHRLIENHIATGQPYVVEARFRHANGQFRWFKVRGCSELDESGQVHRIAGSIQDIHEQKLAQDALQLVQLRFERAIQGTQDGLWEVETQGDGAWYSPRFCALLGFEEHDVPQRIDFLRSRIHPADLRAVTDATDVHYRDNTPFDIELRLQTKSGDYRWFRARAVAERDANDQPLRLSGSLQDVTDARLSREELLRATEAAQAANLAKSAFLANVSHEIRTPMNGILGMTSLLMETELDRTQRDYSETIRASADSLLTVINDILDFSKIEAGKLDIESLELDLRSNVDDVGGMMAFQAAAKKLELVVNVHGDVPQFVRGDPQRIRQCLINLVGNAIKFTRTGEVVIEVRNLGFAETRSESRSATKTLIRFEVRDTGIGIASESLKDLFQPFTQADSSTTRHFGGTGLGLSIVRRLAEMMGGETGASSQLGIGSTFWFTLPLETLTVAQRDATRGSELRGKRVLVVDDNHTNRRVLVGQLEHAGFDVDAEANGVDALTALRQGQADARPFDVALIDFQMPEMDGAMLGERINGDAQLSRTRTIMLTSMDRHGDMRQFAAMGFAGYLAKPVRTGDLFACIDRVLTRDTPGLVTRNVIQEQTMQQKFRGRVLLVEDNAVNQKVARQFLMRLGCDVIIADNGEQGVNAFEGEEFALVLMDLQMPIMDGYAATRRIRDFEGWRKRTPIVALTANAMTGQMERCIAAGMDDFLTKPLDVQKLRDVLTKFGLASDPSLAPARIDLLLSATADEPVDLAQLRLVADNDTVFLRELVAAFVQSAEQIRNEIHAAVRQADGTGVARAAHKLKGASSNLHARMLAKLLGDLETHAHDWTPIELETQLAAIDKALKQVVDCLASANANAATDDSRAAAVKN